MHSLRTAALAGTTLALIFSASAAFSESAGWSYSGAEGPDHWSDLASENSACGGYQQSPIDIKDTIKAELPVLDIDWHSAKGTSVVNTGHTVQVDMPAGSFLERDGHRYELLQMHFHAQSEHRVDGKSYPLEIHFVHKSVDTDALGVLGVFVEPGGTNEAFAQLADEFPADNGERISDDRIDPNAFLPEHLDYFAYEGSLTTPPCSEIVDWMVAKEPIKVAAADIDKFVALYDHNNRPPVAPNRRFVLSSF
ncbi:carbonic anhydrase [Aliihoeflea sp. PC F10.4]